MNSIQDKIVYISVYGVVITWSRLLYLQLGGWPAGLSVCMCGRKIVGVKVVETTRWKDVQFEGRQA